MNMLVLVIAVIALGEAVLLRDTTQDGSKTALHIRITSGMELENRASGNPMSTTAEAKFQVIENISLGEGGFSLGVTQVGDRISFPCKGDRVMVQYVGKLKNGTVFDSSRSLQKPFEFTIGSGDVISGWDQALKDMSLGERGILHVPSYKAYGEDGAGIIPPNEDLDFDIELVAINGRFSASNTSDHSSQGSLNVVKSSAGRSNCVMGTVMVLGVWHMLHIDFT